MNLNKSQRLWLRGYLEPLANELDNEFEEFEKFIAQDKGYSPEKLAEFNHLIDSLINTKEILIELWTDLSDEENVLKSIDSAKESLDTYYQIREGCRLIIKNELAKFGIRI